MTDHPSRRFEAIAYGCDIARDAEANVASISAMLDQLNAVIRADHWPGVTVSELYSQNATLFIQIEPGADALSLELLHAVRAEKSAERRRRTEAAAREPEQRAMF